MQSTGCNVARLQLLQAARRIARYIMVAPAGKEGGWKRWREGETGCSERGAARDEREMTGINGRYADTRNSIGHKTSRDRNK